MIIKLSTGLFFLTNKIIYNLSNKLEVKINGLFAYLFKPPTFKALTKAIGERGGATQFLSFPTHEGIRQFTMVYDNQ